MESLENCGSWEDIIRESGGARCASCSWFKQYGYAPIRFTRDNRVSHNVQQVKWEDERIVQAGKGIPYSLPSLP